MLTEVGVYFRTGENTAAGVSWWFYLFLVLPFQLLIVWPLKMLYWFFKGLVIVCAAVGSLVLLGVRAARDRGRTA